jgi:hypothetical protein
MRAWEIWSYQPPEWPEPHPAVIVSHPDRVASKPEVMVAMCASKQSVRPPESNEVTLDTSDGLDWPTLCKCDLLHTVKKALLKNRRGAPRSTLPALRSPNSPKLHVAAFLVDLKSDALDLVRGDAWRSIFQIFGNSLGV